MSSSSGPSRQQLTKLFAEARRHGVAHEDIYGIISDRWGLMSTKDLAPRQYEELLRLFRARSTAHVSRGARGPERSSDSSRRGNPACPSFPSEPDIAPMLNDTLSCPGHAHAVVLRFAEAGNMGEFEEPDLVIAAKVLDCFRTFRKRRRITVQQALQFLSDFTKWPIAVFREAAHRYLSQHSTMDEAYFRGICKRVAREPSAG